VLCSDVYTAITMFRQLQLCDPFQLDNFDTYSNLLYVKELRVELAHLAHLASERHMLRHVVLWVSWYYNKISLLCNARLENGICTIQTSGFWERQIACCCVTCYVFITVRYAFILEEKKKSQWYPVYFGRYVTSLVDIGLNRPLHITDTW